MLRVPESELTVADRAALRAYFMAVVHGPGREHQAGLTAVRREENQWVTSIPDLMVMQEMPSPKPAPYSNSIPFARRVDHSRSAER